MQACGRCVEGVVSVARGCHIDPEGRTDLRKRALERPTEEGESPVFEKVRASSDSLSTTGHANPVGSRGVHPPRLNTFNDR